MEIANASKQKKREGLFSTFSVHLLKTHLCTNMCVTTAGCFQNKTYQYVFALFITLKIKETKKVTSSLYKPFQEELL